MKKILDEYKRLEKLCNELYDQQHGISLYIADMEATPANLSIMVPNWHVDLKTLKHLRRIRNSLVHDLTEQEVNYTHEDIKDLKEFYQRIMEQKDPIALLLHELNAAEKQEDSTKARESDEVVGNRQDEGLSVKEGLIISLIIVVVVLLTVGILVARDNGWI